MHHDPPSLNVSVIHKCSQSSIDEMVTKNAFRVVDPSPQKFAFLRLLVSQGLEMFTVPLNIARLQKAINATLPNELFIAAFSSRIKKRIPIWYTGGPKHSCRVLRKLISEYEFQRYFDIVSQIYPNGVIGNVFCPIYDSSIRELTPKTNRSKKTLSVIMKRELAAGKVRHYRKMIASVESRKKPKHSSKKSLSRYVVNKYKLKIKNVISNKSNVIGRHCFRIRISLLRINRN